MPINLPYKKISEREFELETEVKISGYNCKIQIPAKLAKKELEGKKLKVTIEVIEE